MTEPQPNPEVQVVHLTQRLDLPVTVDDLLAALDELRIKTRMVADQQAITMFDDGESLLLQVSVQGLQEQE